MDTHSYQHHGKVRKMLTENSEYGIWAAKERLMDKHIKAGDTIIIGDSLACAGLIPTQLSADTFNLPMGGATPIDGYYTLHYLIKKNKPQSA